MIAPMEAGDSYGGRRIPQPTGEVSLQPEWRRRSGSSVRSDNLILQPEWRRGKPTGSTSEPRNPDSGGETRKVEKDEEKEVLLQPEWRRSRPTATFAYPWDQNYVVPKPVASSSSGVQRSRDMNETRRTAPPSGIFNIPLNLNLNYHTCYLLFLFQCSLG